MVCNFLTEWYREKKRESFCWLGAEPADHCLQILTQWKTLSGVFQSSAEQRKLYCWPSNNCWALPHFPARIPNFRYRAVVFRNRRGSLPHVHLQNEFDNLRLRHRNLLTLSDVAHVSPADIALLSNIGTSAKVWFYCELIATSRVVK